jgi:small subunit ribosomal protein S18
MAKKKKKTQKKQVFKIDRDCIYCEKGEDPHYKDYRALRKFMSDRARIYGKMRTGLCTKHQRRMTVAIKRARHLGLLPFTPQI